VNRLTLQTLEICRNPFRDSRGLALSELIYKPFHRIATGLRVIASAMPMAQRHNVRRYSAGIIGARIIDGYPMIRRERVPQPRLTTTDGTAVIEVGEGASPVALCKGVRQSLSRSTSPLLFGGSSLRVLLFRLRGCGPYLVWVGITIAFLLCLYPLRGSYDLTRAGDVSGLAFGVYPFLVGGIPIASALFYLSLIGFIVFMVARLASGADPVFTKLGEIEILWRCRVFIIALRTAFYGKIRHRITSHKGCTSPRDASIIDGDCRLLPKLYHENTKLSEAISAW
jgi:hypothetical protein